MIAKIEERIAALEALGLPRIAADAEGFSGDLSYLRECIGDLTDRFVALEDQLEAMRRARIAEIEARCLARFRADPSKVRVAVRRQGGLWRVQISSGALFVSWLHRSPARALVLAWRAAVEQELPGLDPGMGWAYPHPQGVCR